MLAPMLLPYRRNHTLLSAITPGLTSELLCNKPKNPIAQTDSAVWFLLSPTAAELHVLQFRDKV